MTVGINVQIKHLYRNPNNSSRRGHVIHLNYLFTILLLLILMTCTFDGEWNLTNLIGSNERVTRQYQLCLCDCLSVN